MANCHIYLPQESCNLETNPGLHPLANFALFFFTDFHINFYIYTPEISHMGKKKFKTLVNFSICLHSALPVVLNILLWTFVI